MILGFANVLNRLALKRRQMSAYEVINFATMSNKWFKTTTN